MKTINHAMAIVRADNRNFIVTGGVSNRLDIYSADLSIFQQINFNGWIRDISCFKIDEDENEQFAVASGDKYLRVFAYIKDRGNFEEIWNFPFDNKVTAVSAADINADGRQEIIAGSWDRTIKVFDASTGLKLWELCFDDWVVKIKTLDVNWDGIPEILVGLKKGQFGVINGITGDCYWDFAFNKRINDIDLVKLADNKFPHVLIGGDEPILYIFDIYGQMIKQIPLEDRIRVITHGDIDGDGLNEVILGLTNKKLYVYESVLLKDKDQDKYEANNKTLSEIGSDESIIREKTNEKIDKKINKEITTIIDNIDNSVLFLEENLEIKKNRYNLDLALRWRARLANNATNIIIKDIYDDCIPKIIITGYLGGVKIIQDNYFGKHTHNEFCNSIDCKPPKAYEFNPEYRESIEDIIGIPLLKHKDQLKLIESEGFFFSPKKIINLDDLISFDNFKKSLNKLNVVELESQKLDFNDSEPQRFQSKGLQDEESSNTDKETPRILISTVNHSTYFFINVEYNLLKFKEYFINKLKDENLLPISNLDEIINVAKINGFTTTKEITLYLNLLKSLNIAIPSSLTSAVKGIPQKTIGTSQQQIETSQQQIETSQQQIETPQQQIETPQQQIETPQQQGKLNKELKPFDLIIKLLQENQRMTKQKIYSNLKDKFDKNTIDDEILNLKIKGIIKFFRNKPSGYGLIAKSTVIPDVSKTIQPTTKVKEIPSKVASTISEPTIRIDNNKEAFIQNVLKEGVIPTKAKLETMILSLGISKTQFQELFTELKREGILLYSRKTPRGYSIKSDYRSISSLPIKDKKHIAQPTKPIQTTKPTQPTKIKTQPAKVKAQNTPPIQAKITTTKTDLTKGQSEKITEKIEHKDERSVFISAVKAQGVVSSKAKLQDLILNAGLDTATFIRLFEELKKDKILKYSKSKPRGYSISDMVNEISPTLKKEIVDETKKIPKDTAKAQKQRETSEKEEVSSEEISKEEINKEEISFDPIEFSMLSKEKQKEIFLNIFKMNKIYSSKAKLLQFITSKGIPQSIATEIFEQLKSQKIIKYSKSTPRGYSLL